MKAKTEDDSRRIKRIDTRVTKLMIALGINPYISEAAQLATPVVTIDGGTVSISSLDVSLLTIKQALFAEYAEAGTYDIECNGTFVATVRLEQRVAQSAA